MCMYSGYFVQKFDSNFFVKPRANNTRLTRSALEPTVSFSTPSSSSVGRRTPPTITPVDTTPLAKKSWIFAWTESANSRTTALGCRDFSASMPWEVAPGLDWAPCCWNVSPWITARNPSWIFASTPHPRYLHTNWRSLPGARVQKLTRQNKPRCF